MLKRPVSIVSRITRTLVLSLFLAIVISWCCVLLVDPSSAAYRTGTIEYYDGWWSYARQDTPGAVLLTSWKRSGAHAEDVMSSGESIGDILPGWTGLDTEVGAFERAARCGKAAEEFLVIGAGGWPVECLYYRVVGLPVQGAVQPQTDLLGNWEAPDAQCVVKWGMLTGLPWSTLR